MVSFKYFFPDLKIKNVQLFIIFGEFVVNVYGGRQGLFTPRFDKAYFVFVNALH